MEPNTPGDGPAQSLSGPAMPPVPPPPPAAPAMPPVPPAGPAVPGVPPAGRSVGRLPWVVAAVAVVVALGALTFAVLRPAPLSGAADSREHGSSSPEAAVRFLAERLAAKDGAGAASAFAVEHLVDGYSFQAQAERLRVVTAMTWLPSSSDGYRALSIAERRGTVASQLRFLVEALVAPDLDLNVTQEVTGSTTAADIEADLAPDALASLTVVRVDEIASPGDRAAEALAASGKPYGADEVQEVAVLLGTDHGPQLAGMRVVRFGSDWYVWDLSSAVLGTGYASLEPTSEEQYLDTVEQARDLN